MKESEQYTQVCKDRFDGIEGKLDDIIDRLFLDNGNECLQSKVNNNARIIKIIAGIFTVIGTAVVSVICWIIKAKL